MDSQKGKNSNSQIIVIFNTKSVRRDVLRSVFKNKKSQNFHIWKDIKILIFKSPRPIKVGDFIFLLFFFLSFFFLLSSDQFWISYVYSFSVPVSQIVCIFDIPVSQPVCIFSVLVSQHNFVLNFLSAFSVSLCPNLSAFLVSLCPNMVLLSTSCLHFQCPCVPNFPHF